MADILILGTDTNAGKTTFCLLWLSAFAEHFEYWKPVETGPSDSEQVRRLTGAVVHPPLKRFREPIAPALAAQLENDTVPSSQTIVASRQVPGQGRGLVIETFGSPFSPLTADELQIELIKQLHLPCVLVPSSALGAIGRTIQCLDALAPHGITPLVVLLGASDDFAAEQIRRHRDVKVFSLSRPATWSREGMRDSAIEQSSILDTIRQEIESGAGFPACRQAGKPAPRLATSATANAPLIERDRQAVWHPYTSLLDPDASLECVGAQDEFLWLADGRRVIDGISSWWTILHGHRYPPLMAALREAMERFDHVQFAGVTHEPAVELAELLLSTAPWQGGRVFYSDNGSTAVEVALKMAYQYWRHRGEQRNCFIGFEGAYHGDTFGAMAVSRDPLFFGAFEPLLCRAEIVPLSPERLADALKQLKGSVAAVILEPLVQGAGGMRMHSPETLRQIVEVTHEQETLFIADEVMTGGGRTGTLWAHQAAGVAPDLICAAKTLAGGILPLAATLVSPQVAAAFATPDRNRTFFHGHSFTAHPLACAVAVANWRVLSKEQDVNALRIERFWRTELAPLRQMPGVKEVRICGTIAAVEVEANGGYLAEAGRRMRRRCLQDGVLLRPLGNVIYAMPPLRTTAASLKQIATAMKNALGEFGLPDRLD